jgi:hypothetical protein
VSDTVAINAVSKPRKKPTTMGEPVPVEVGAREEHAGAATVDERHSGGLVVEQIPHGAGSTSPGDAPSRQGLVHGRRVEHSEIGGTSTGSGQAHHTAHAWRFFYAFMPPVADDALIIAAERPTRPALKIQDSVTATKWGFESPGPWHKACSTRGSCPLMPARAPQARPLVRRPHFLPVLPSSRFQRN